LKNLHPEDCNFGAQISYQALTKMLQGVTLDKAYTRLDWSTRPLPDKAIEYALDDVTYLIKNYYQLKTLLENEQKMDWQMQEGVSLLAINLYKVDIFQVWNRIKGFSRLPKHTQTFAVQLAAWREYQAIDKNKPRKWIITDDDLIDIATGKRHLSENKQQQFDKFLLDNPDEIEINAYKHIPPTAEEKAQKVILQKVIQEKANQYNLTTEMIASSKTLLKYIRGDQSVNFLSGWRYQILKEELKKCKIV
jgi:ribonuclease D